MKKIILVAGATGNLRLRIVKALLNKDAEIRAVVWTTVKDVLLKYQHDIKI